MMFSVIIPLYNKELHIKRTVQSVLQQTYKNFEIIIVNDGSTDNSLNSIAMISDPRIKIISQKNAGVSAARNLGITSANGDYIAFLDADDEWREYFLSEINSLINLFPTAGLFATSYSVCRNIKGSLINKNIGTNFTRYELDYFKESYINEFPVHTSAVCIPKNIFEENGFFLTDVYLGEDLEMWARIALKYQVAYSTKKCSIYYRTTNNTAVNELSLNRFAQSETIEKALAKDDLLQMDTFYIKEYLAKCDLYQSRQLILNNYKEEAKNILNQCETQDQNIKIYLLRMAIYLPGSVLLISHKLGMIVKRIVRKIYS